VRGVFAKVSNTPAPDPAYRPARTPPGVSNEPDCFQITLYTLDKDERTNGFPIVE
jgi:hypothetical protein